jgi:hypothetical protein
MYQYGEHIAHTFRIRPTFFFAQYPHIYLYTSINGEQMTHIFRNGAVVVVIIYIW